MIVWRLLFLLIGLTFALPIAAQSDAMAAESSRAKRLMSEGRFGEAVPIYEKLLLTMPSNAGIQLNLAMALHMSGGDAKAIPHFEAVLKQQPQSLPALMLLSASYLRTGKPDKAVPLLQRALKIAPEDTEGRSMMIDALLMLDRHEAAIPHLRYMAAAQPENPRVWFGLGKAYEAVAQRAFESLEKAGPDSPWWLYLAGDVRLKMDRNTAAFTLFRAALEKQPSLRGAHAALAEIYRKTNHADWATVEEELERKQPAPPCAAPSAECHFIKGRHQQSLAAALAAKTPEALFWQARAANEMARQSFKRLAQLPPSVESHQAMAELYRNQGRHNEAIKEWRAALELAPGDPRLQQELATSVYMSRDYPNAEKLVRDLISKDPEVPELQFILGDSLMGQQKLEEAIPPLEKALSLRKDYLAAHAVLGRALLQTGQADRAIPHLKTGLATDNDGSLYIQLSRAYRATGQPALAEEMIQKYQEIRKTAGFEGVIITPPQR